MWIKISDQLPESGKHVFVCCEIRLDALYICDAFYAAPNSISCTDGDDIDCTYSEEDDEFYLTEGWYEVIKNWGDYNSITINDTVTHWMPMPKLPKEVS